MEEKHFLIPDKLKIIQDNEFFKFGTDSVFLANFARLRYGVKVVDFGSGSGVIPLLLAYKQNPDHITGLEIKSELVGLAKRNIRLNDMEDKIEIKQVDFTKASHYFKPDIDIVISNPPYLKVGGGAMSQNKHKAIARHELKATLRDVIREAGKILRYGGIFYLVHRSSRLAETMDLLAENNLAAKRLRIVYPRLKKDSDCFLLEAKKGGKIGLTIEPPLIVYKADLQEYTEEVKGMYRADYHE
jgi:tRNA1(Val) A37 N6-methylase TrmN6